MPSLPPMRNGSRQDGEADNRRPKVRRRCPSHCGWVRKHACSVPNCLALPIEVAHVREGTNAGLGLKPSDDWTVALCRDHHGEQHRIGEGPFGEKYGDGRGWLKGLALAFAKASPHRSKLKELG